MIAIALHISWIVINYLYYIDAVPAARAAARNSFRIFKQLWPDRVET
jgi:hypothetical protein